MKNKIISIVDFTCFYNQCLEVLILASVNEKKYGSCIIFDFNDKNPFISFNENKIFNNSFVFYRSTENTLNKKNILQKKYIYKDSPIIINPNIHHKNNQIYLFSDKIIIFVDFIKFSFKDFFYFINKKNINLEKIILFFYHYENNLQNHKKYLEILKLIKSVKFVIKIVELPNLKNLDEINKIPPWINIYIEFNKINN